MENKRQYILSLLMLGALYFVFGLVSWVNSILVPYFKVACELQSQVQVYLANFAFYIAYLVMTIPASLMLNRTGYKKGTMYGLWVLALGAFLFTPAALTREYSLFLVALFTMGTGLAILQTVANPFVTIIGPLDSAARRMSIMGVCNKFAGIIAPIVFAAIVIGPGDKLIMDQVQAGELTGAAKDAALNELVRGVIPPYLVLGVLLVIFGVIFFKSGIQDINPSAQNKSTEEGGERKSILSYPYLVLGALALLLHLGSQVISVNTIIGYAQGALGYDLLAAKVFPSYTLGCILFGYLFGIVLIPKYLKQKTALQICTCLGLVLSFLVVLTPVKSSIWFLVLLGIPNSLIYAGIWPLAIRNLGKWTNLGSSLLVMGLCGNAILPLIYAFVADRFGSLQIGYWVLVPCFAYMIFYAFKGYKIENWK